MAVAPRGAAAFCEVVGSHASSSLGERARAPHGSIDWTEWSAGGQRRLRFAPHPHRSLSRSIAEHRGGRSRRGRQSNVTACAWWRYPEAVDRRRGTARGSLRPASRLSTQTASSGINPWFPVRSPGPVRVLKRLRVAGGQLPPGARISLTSRFRFQTFGQT